MPNSGKPEFGWGEGARRVRGRKPHAPRARNTASIEMRDHGAERSQPCGQATRRFFDASERVADKIGIAGFQRRRDIGGLPLLAVEIIGGIETCRLLRRRSFRHYSL